MSARTNKIAESTSRVTGAGKYVDGRRQRGGLPKLHTIKAVAEAVDVSSRTVRRWIENGDLPVHRVDSVVRVAEDDLRAFLALHRQG
jgi:excisionase family DNA binding protein